MPSWDFLASGAVLEAWSWRSVFWLNVVLAVVALIGTVTRVPESAQRGRRPVDVVGALLTVAGLGVLVYSIIEAPNHGWGSVRTLVGIAAGLVVLADFVAWELRQSHPLLDPRLFRRVHLSAGALSVTLQFFGLIFVMMQYLQLVRGDSALMAAVNVLPMAAAMLPAARLSLRLTDRFGARGPWTVGLLLIAAGFIVLSRLEGSSAYGLLVAGLLPLGAGMGMAMTPATASITDTLPLPLQNIGSAVNDLSRKLGGALGIAVLGSVLDAAYRGHLDVTGFPPSVADAARSSLAAASALHDPAFTTQARDAFTTGMHWALLAGAAAVVLAALAVHLLLHRHPDRPERDASSDSAPRHRRRSPSNPRDRSR